ncbi:Importin subunit alpha-3 [Cardamine amara subsp. amara]|uniref:Importin subunit alpha n=1 Tax=Cardamine amara subsp. amara TaxID=228776 RepID=A0ABD1C6U6_CARAN
MSLRPSAKTEVRRNRYKVAVDAEEGRRRREDNMVEIRKNKREENLQKKRREGVPASSMAFGSAGAQPEDSAKKLKENLPAMCAGIWSEDSNSQLEATNLLRKLLSIEQNPPINDVVQSGIVPRVVTFLSRDDFPQLQFEAAWALTNIASGTSENTNVIIESGAVPIFIQLLSSASEDVREQAVWALGNVAGDSPSCRDLVLSYGAMTPLLALFNEHTKLSMLRNATWTLSNFCRGKPQPSFEQTQASLPVLKRLVQSEDDEVLTDACWALSYLSDNSNDKIQAVIQAGVVPRLIELLAHSSPSVLIPALRTIGNIVTGDDQQTQMVLDHQALPSLLALLTNTNKKSIKKEACWTISNITAGNKNQIQAVIDAGIVQSLVLVLHSAEFDVKKEAAWGISNATSGGTHDQIKFLVNQGCIKPLCDLLTCPDPKVIMVCLEALENILVVGEAEKSLGYTGDDNLHVQMIDEAEGLEKIENLQSHDNNDIYQKAVKILETFWTEDDEEEGNDENHAPQSGFQFGSTNVPPGQFDFI